MTAGEWSIEDPRITAGRSASRPKSRQPLVITLSQSASSSARTRLGSEPRFAPLWPAHVVGNVKRSKGRIRRAELLVHEFVFRHSDGT
jgi:hypothetical protein